MLSLFGERAPESVADENSHGFRVRIARLLQNKLPRTDPLARMELLAIADDAAFNAIEGSLFAAARAEAETPSRGICRLTAALSNGPSKTTRTAIPSGDFTAGKPS